MLFFNEFTTPSIDNFVSLTRHRQSSQTLISLIDRLKTASRSYVYNIIITWCEIGMRPKSRVAFVGPHSPLAQSGNGTMTVCNSSQMILNLHTLLNFIGSPVKYSLGVTELANISSKNAPLLGACTRNETMFPRTDWNND